MCRNPNWLGRSAGYHIFNVSSSSLPVFAFRQGFFAPRIGLKGGCCAFRARPNSTFRSSGRKPPGLNHSFVRLGSPCWTESEKRPSRFERPLTKSALGARWRHGVGRFVRPMTGFFAFMRPRPHGAARVFSKRRRHRGRHFMPSTPHRKTKNKTARLVDRGVQSSRSSQRRRFPFSFSFLLAGRAGRRCGLSDWPAAWAGCAIVIRPAFTFGLSRRHPGWRTR